jgi:hypothetical protein
MDCKTRHSISRLQIRFPVCTADKGARLVVREGVLLERLATQQKTQTTNGMAGMSCENR